VSRELVDEIRQFITGLRQEWPRLFPAFPRKAQEREWIEKARKAFTEKADFYRAPMGVRYRSIRIKDQRTLWGSCSRAGNLNFNWRVILAPPGVLDYLVVHELAHLIEMNHSRRFWQTVASHCPDWKVHRRWLREHSAELKAGPRRD
jgi:predicted metal-dependent hydrolase